MKITVTAPGRINLIGEHTDYNQGFVMPAAINISLNLEYSSRRDRTVSVTAASFKESEFFTLDSLKPLKGKLHWVDYIKAVYWVLEQEGYLLSGADINIVSAIPIGSGLSSSAALELAVAAAINEAHLFKLGPEKISLLCQKAENSYIGVNSGIMDQYAIALGRKAHALLLDCRSLEYRYIPINLGALEILVVDSRVDRSLAYSAYNRRREECEEAVSKMSSLTGVNKDSLRDVSLEEIKFCRDSLPLNIYKRARFVVEENIRVLRAETALAEDDLESFGSYLQRSHAGLRDLYEVSCPELDRIVECAANHSGVLGARMTGAGFGGCAIVLLKSSVVEQFQENLVAAFNDLKWTKPVVYRVVFTDGLSVGKTL
jgi:galactokinase